MLTFVDRLGWVLVWVLFGDLFSEQFILLVLWCLTLNVAYGLGSCCPSQHFQFSLQMTEFIFLNSVMCMHVDEYERSKAYTWRSEDNLWESVLSFHYEFCIH